MLFVLDGDYGFAPTAIQVGIPALVEITNNYGVGVLINYQYPSFCSFVA